MKQTERDLRGLICVAAYEAQVDRTIWTMITSGAGQ